MSGRDLDYGFSGFLSVSDEEYESAQDRKAAHVYESFVEPVLDSFESDKVFQPGLVEDAVRPPYSYVEVRDALEYGAENSDSLSYLEEDMDLFLYRRE